MNILNNIWIAISTPNEALSKIFCVLFLFIEAPLSFALINNSCTKKQKYTYILTIASVAGISTLFMNWPFNIIFNYTSAFLVLYFVLKMNFISALIATIFPSVVLNLIVNLIANPYFDLLKITYEEANTILIYRLPFILLTYLIAFIFNLIIKYRKITLNVLEDFDKKTKSIITINFIKRLFNDLGSFLFFLFTFLSLLCFIKSTFLYYEFFTSEFDRVSPRCTARRAERDRIPRRRPRRTY